MNDPLSRIIATELQARPEQVDSAIRLLDEGNTVPFIARYRKGSHRGPGRHPTAPAETRTGYLRELEDRRQTILKSIDEQGKLTEQLAGAINATLSKTELEDLYLPYKPKRRTRGGSPSRPVWNRWRTRCGRIRNSSRNSWLNATSMPTRAWRTSKPPSTARAIS